MLEEAGPFGAANPEPVLAFAGHRIKSVQQVGENHIRVVAEAPDGTKMTAVAFRAASTALGDALKSGIGRTAHLAGTSTLNRWGGGTGRAELRLLDVALV